MKSKDDARRTYREAITRGDAAQLLEQKRTDIFELVYSNLFLKSLLIFDSIFKVFDEFFVRM